MARVVDVTVRVADMREFRVFVRAAGDVIRAYDAARDDVGAMGPAIDALRDAMLDLVADDET